MNEYVKIIRSIKATLNKVTAEGADNWLRLTACYQALENMEKAMISESGESQNGN